MNQKYISIIKEMQAIYSTFDQYLGQYESKHGAYYINELLGNLSVLGCCLSELEILMENDR